MSEFRRAAIVYFCVYSVLMIAEWIFGKMGAPYGKLIIAAHCAMLFTAFFGKSQS